METKNIKPLIQAILFASGDPVSLERLASSLEISAKEISQALNELIIELEGENSGICIIKMDNRFQMCAKPVFSEEIRKVVDLKRHAPLSGAAMEVLAIISYNQPVTKAFVSEVRGVDCSGIVASLVEKNLIEEKGRLNLPGRPLLYGTTSNFLKCFGIVSLDELPPLPKKDKNAIEEELFDIQNENSEEK